MTGEYLSDIVNLDDIQPGKINLIYAPCGSGKTTFAKTKLLKFYVYGDDYLEYGDKVEEYADIHWSTSFKDHIRHTNDKILYLIDSSIGKEQLLQSDGAYQTFNSWTGEEQWELPGFTVMTYAGYGMLCKQAPDKNRWSSCSMIVCDELHNAVKWSKWKKDDEENLCELALSAITYAADIGESTVIALSATPDAIREEFEWILHEVKLTGEPRCFDNFSEINYSNLNLLLKQIPTDKRGIIYVSHIKTIKKCQALLNERGIKNVALWSTQNAKHPLTEEQWKVRKYIIQKKEMPPEYNVLLINKSCETSITIGNSENTVNPIDYMIIHNREFDTVIQARGRYRNDLAELYLLDSDYDDIVYLSHEWLNRRLNKADKDKLCEELDFRDKTNGRLMKWTKVKRILKENDYEIKDVRTNTERWTVISLA